MAIGQYGLLQVFSSIGFMWDNDSLHDWGLLMPKCGGLCMGLLSPFKIGPDVTSHLCPPSSSERQEEEQNESTTRRRLGVYSDTYLFLSRNVLNILKERGKM